MIWECTLIQDGNFTGYTAILVIQAEHLASFKGWNQNNNKTTPAVPGSQYSFTKENDCDHFRHWQEIRSLGTS